MSVSAPLQLSATAAVAGDTLHAAPLAGGGHVDVWTSADAGNAGVNHVYAQVFDASNTRLGAPVAVFGTTQTFAAHGVAGLDDGSFLVSGNTSVYDNVANTLILQVYTQKLATSGQLLPTGGVTDPAVNGGLADRVESKSFNEGYVNLLDGPILPGPGGSYTLGVRRDTYPTPTQFYEQWLVGVDAAGAASSNTDLGGATWWRPALARLASGNILFARTAIVPGPGVFVTGPVQWSILSPTGQVLAQQMLAAGTNNPQVAALADGTALVGYTDPAGQAIQVLHLGADGSVLGTASMPSNAGWITALPDGRFVFTWPVGSQLRGQYFSASGVPSGDAFLLASDVDTSDPAPVPAVAPAADGFVLMYQGTDKALYQVQASSGL